MFQNHDQNPPKNIGVGKSTISTQNKKKSSLIFRQPLALTLVKKESQLIAKNPLRFLDNFASGKCTPTDTSSITSLIGNVDYNTQELFQDKVKEFQNKHKLSKTRTLLLNMSSTPGLPGFISPNNSGIVTPSGPRSTRSATSNTPNSSRSATSATSMRSSKSAKSLRSLKSLGWGDQSDLKCEEFNYYNENLNKGSCEEVERAIEQFIDQIKNSDIDNIILWISTLATMQDFKLPFGFPKNLHIPTNPPSLKCPILSSFVSDSCDEFLLLDCEYSTKLEEVSSRLKENFDSIKTSKWSPQDSALLYYIITTLELTEDTNGLRQRSAEMFRRDLVLRLFPEFNEEQVAWQKYRLRMKRAWEEKRDNIIKDWVRDKEELQQKINSGWAAIQQKQAKQQKLAHLRKEQKERCKYWKEQLEHLRKEKRDQIRRIEIMVEPYEKNMESRERLRMEEEERKRNLQKELLEEYKQKRVEKLHKDKADMERMEEELERNKQMQDKYNRTRVYIRQFEYEKKQEAQKELERLRAEEQKLKMALLEKSKEKVEIDYHPISVMADTHASLVRRHEVQSLLRNQEEENMVKFFQERYSFSSDTVLKDRRVRLEGKLRDAGLIDCPYARQVLMAMEPKAKPHLHSHIQFKED